MSSLQQTAPTFSVLQFGRRWQGSRLTERSAAQSHFIDLCDVLGRPTPAEVDQEGSFYTFEKGVNTTSGRPGFADVWLRGHFAWGYKKARANLAEAYRQLLTQMCLAVRLRLWSHPLYSCWPSLYHGDSEIAS